MCVNHRRYLMSKGGIHCRISHLFVLYNRQITILVPLSWCTLSSAAALVSLNLTFRRGKLFPPKLFWVFYSEFFFLSLMFAVISYELASKCFTLCVIICFQEVLLTLEWNHTWNDIEIWSKLKKSGFQLVECKCQGLPGVITTTCKVYIIFLNLYLGRRQPKRNY